MNHKPSQTILFLAPLLALMFIAPEVIEYIKIETEIVEENEIDSKQAIAEIIDEEDDFELELDSIPIQVEIVEDSVVEKMFEINFNRWNPSYASHNSTTIPDSLKFLGSKVAFEKMHRFFEKLEYISEDDVNPVEIFHWGDSQIEGDRISGVLRSSWQKSWGGCGPGLIPAIQPIPALSIRQDYDGNLTRYTKFGVIDSTIEHSAYGPMGVFCMVRDDANIFLQPHPRGFKLNKVWPRLKVSIGSAPIGGNITLIGNKNPYRVLDISPASNSMHQDIEIKLFENESELKIGFEGYNIEITGLELGCSSGVQLHNIPLRGNSGLIFTKLDSKHLYRTIENRDIGLMILQFGGNVVPHIKDSTDAKKYSRRLAKQISLLKKMKPDALIIVIGPSDMGISNSESPTYQFLETVINCLKETTISEDCLYWNTYEVMGGCGSIKKWSEQDPKLASPDLVHFTPKGARVIGERFDIAFRAEYKSWLEWNR